MSEGGILTRLPGQKPQAEGVIACAGFKKGRGLGAAPPGRSQDPAATCTTWERNAPPPSIRAAPNARCTTGRHAFKRVLWPSQPSINHGGCVVVVGHRARSSLLVACTFSGPHKRKW